ncbi:MAG: hypothetical protein H0T73_19170 [Ardenticatenales bacterium]|nr:hypothetical protein [Ardenticatenales bacterium]
MPEIALPSMSNYQSTQSGGLLAVGQSAQRLQEICRNIDTFWQQWSVTPLWLSPLRLGASETEHPQQVISAHTGGKLAHAACLPFFDELNDNTPTIYAGFNTAHRLEPLRPLDPTSRFECFHVAEVIIVGDKAFCEQSYQMVRDELGTFLEGYVAGRWHRSNDSFMNEMTTKEEWVVGSGAYTLAVASGNDHGQHFLGRRGLAGESRCLGIGIERLFTAIQRFAKTQEN